MRNKYRSHKADLKAAKAAQRQEAETQFVHFSREAVLLVIGTVGFTVAAVLLLSM